MRNILFHCHFFKNAGSSIDWALSHCFGEHLHRNKEHFYSVFEWNDYLISLLSTNREITAVTSHMFTVSPPHLENFRIYPIALYRHPIERVTSVVTFDRKRHYCNSSGIITDVNAGISDYVEAYLKKGTPATIRNIHTLRFAGRDNGLPVYEKDFMQAVKTVKQITTIGLVEKFDESMVLFEEHLKPVFPNLDLSYVRQNVHQKPATIDNRLKELHDQLGDELYEKLCAENDFDLRLYEVARTIFTTRIQEIDDFEDKLKYFRHRCLALNHE